MEDPKSSGKSDPDPDAQHCGKVPSNHLCLGGDDGPGGVEMGEGDQVHENTETLAAQYLHNILPVQDQFRQEQHQPITRNFNELRPERLERGGHC
jgi:hypothetical protein